MTRALVDDVTVLGLDEDGRAVLPDLPYLVAGAALADLALSGRVERPDRTVIVTDGRPIGHPVLDAFLTRIADTRRGRSATRWVFDSARWLGRVECDHLARTGVLRSTGDSVLGLIPRTRYAVADPAARAALLDRSGALLLGDAPTLADTAADPHDRMLLSLLGTTSQPRRTAAVLAPEVDAPGLRARLTATDGHWVITGTARAIRLVHAARA